MQKKDEMRKSDKEKRGSMRPVYERLTQTETLNVNL